MLKMLAAILIKFSDQPDSSECNYFTNMDSTRLQHHNQLSITVLP